MCVDKSQFSLIGTRFKDFNRKRYHCRRFALSDSSNKSFQSPCSHKHTDNYEKCDSLGNVIEEIKKAVIKLGESIACDSSLVELKEELLFL